MAGAEGLLTGKIKDIGREALGASVVCVITDCWRLLSLIKKSHKQDGYPVTDGE